jgi:hypothetical protein
MVWFGLVVKPSVLVCYPKGREECLRTGSEENIWTYEREEK